MVTVTAVATSVSDLLDFFREFVKLAHEAGLSGEP